MRGEEGGGPAAHHQGGGRAALSGAAGPGAGDDGGARLRRPRPFLEDQLDTIRRVRALIEKYNPACELEVDGGIAPKTAPLVVEAGANVLVAGSAVYGAADPAAAIAALRGGR